MRSLERITTRHRLFSMSPLARSRLGEMKPGRNESYPCGSGKKFKRCHGALAQSISVSHTQSSPLPLDVTQRKGCLHHKARRSQCMVPTGVRSVSSGTQCPTPKAAHPAPTNSGELSRRAVRSGRCLDDVGVWLRASVCRCKKRKKTTRVLCHSPSYWTHHRCGSEEQTSRWDTRLRVLGTLGFSNGLGYKAPAPKCGRQGHSRTTPSLRGIERLRATGPGRKQRHLPTAG
jgi:hypothetical protein